jgi:hypothetical protein
MLKHKAHKGHKDFKMHNSQMVPVILAKPIKRKWGSDLASIACSDLIYFVFFVPFVVTKPMTDY